MKSCNVGEEHNFRWGGILFKKFFSGGGIKYPQVLVAEYPGMDKMLFEVDIDNLSSFIELPVLSGSIISGYDGRPISPLFKGSVRVVVLTKYVRVPNIEELDFYERYSKL